MRFIVFSLRYGDVVGWLVLCLCVYLCDGRRGRAGLLLYLSSLMLMYTSPLDCIHFYLQALRQHAPEARVAVHVQATTEEVN